MSRRKPKILFVDDERCWHLGINTVFSEKYEISYASTVEEAKELFNKNKFYWVLIDFMLRGSNASGSELARWCRKKNPHTVITLMTSGLEILSDEDISSANDVIAKDIGGDTLYEAAENVVWLKRMPVRMRRKWGETIKPLKKYQYHIRYVGRTGSDAGVEKIHATLANGTKKKRLRIAFTVYSFPETDKVVICLASSIGCVGRCLFCQSKERKFIRQMTTEEIVAQVLLALQGFIARKLFDKERGENKRLIISFSAEGDSISSNYDNVIRAIKILNELNSTGISLSFIITTIGHEGNLAKLLEELSTYHLPVTVYWSLNFADENKRTIYMPWTKGQSIVRTRDILIKITKLTGRILTVAYIVFRGLNDRDEDVSLLKQLFGEKSLKGLFNIKIAAAEPNSLEVGKLLQTTENDVDKFGEKLMVAGLPWRKRKIIGGEINAGCGTTIPLNDDEKIVIT